MNCFWLQQGSRYAAFQHKPKQVHAIVQGDVHLINKTYTRFGAHRLWGNLLAQGWCRVEAPMTFSAFLATVDPLCTTLL